MRGMARVVVLGNLTRDPEDFSAGCRFAVAVNERVKKGDEWQDHASYFDITVFGKQAEACSQYLKKGSPVAIDGKLRQDRWTNDAGDKRQAVKVIADQVVFLSSGEKREPERDPIDDFGPSPERERSAEEDRQLGEEIKEMGW